MDRLKTLLKYIIWIALFWIISDFLINVGINSTYKTIERLDNLEQIQIYQSEATLINGRIKGAIKNNTENNISGKYVKLELYSERNVQIGDRYIEIGELAEGGTKPLDIYFKVNNVKYYKLSISDDKGPEENFEIQLLGEDMTGAKIFWGVAIILMIW